MKKFVASAFLFALCAVVAATGGEKKKDAKVEGAWNAIGGSMDGKKLTPEVLEKLQLVVTIKEGKYSVTVAGKEVEAGTYKVDPAKTPVELDLTIASGEDKGKVQLGILKLEGEVLTAAFSKAAKKDRPKNFEGGEGIHVTIMKRGK